MKWVSSLLSQFSRPISIRYLLSQSRARILLLGWPVIRKYFPDLIIFHVLKGWNSFRIGAVDHWNHSSGGWSPFFTQLKLKWVTMTTWAKSDVIPSELFAIKLYSKWFHFFKFSECFRIQYFFKHNFLQFFVGFSVGTFTNDGIKHF